MAREGVISRADCISRKLRESRIVKYRTRPRFLFLLSREIIFDFSLIEQESPCEIDDSPVRIMRTILSTMFLRNTCLLLLLLPSRDITSEINWRKPAANSVNRNSSPNSDACTYIYIAKLTRFGRS